MESRFRGPGWDLEDPGQLGDRAALEVVEDEDRALFDR